MTTREVSYNLAGCVRNMSLPVAGTTILLYDFWSTGQGLMRHFVAQQVTGARGDFSFDVRKGIYSMEVVPNRQTRFARQSIEAIKVMSNTTLNFSLQNGCELSGVVRMMDGAAVGDCRLEFYGIDEVVRAAEAVDEQGHFSISLPRGRYHVACRHTGGAGNQRHSFLCPTLGVVELQRDLRGQDIILPALVTFTGTVTDSQGHPVRHVKVTVRPTHPGETPYIQEMEAQGVSHTDKSGLFECAVEPGLYDLKLEPAPEYHLSERLVTAILVDQARARTYSLAPGYRLAGAVNYNGEPVENALVTVRGGKIDSSTLTDADGRYSFALSGGSYELTVSSQPDSLARLPHRLLAPSVATLQLAEDMVYDFDLQEGVTVSGKVTDDAGKPRPSVQLAVYASLGGQIDTTSGGDRPLLFGISADDGSYEFRVSEGDYCLVVNNQQSTARQFTAGQEDLHNDLMWHAGCVVYFEIFSDVDEPVPNCRVICEPYQSTADGSPEEPLNQGVSDERGVCRLAVPAGIYAFRFEPPEPGAFQPRTVRQLSINCDLRRKVKLAPKPAPAQPAPAP